MSLVDACALVALVAMILYAVLGGADFGGGVFHLLALLEGSRARRKAIAEAMGPVWEGNHVFLVLLVVVFFSAFPRAWAAYATALAVPLRVALVAIAVRGVAFVFRAYTGPRLRAAFGTAFGLASIVSPLVLGACVGAVSAGRLSLEAHEGAHAAAWTSPLSVAMAVTALVTSTHLAAVFLTVETHGALRESFRRRAWLTGFAAGGCALVTLAVVDRTVPHLARGLLGPRAALVLAVGVVAWCIAMGALRVGRERVARRAVVVGASALLLGWAIAQHPYLIYPTLTLEQAAAPAPMLRFLLGTLPIGVGLVVPSMALAFHVFKARPAHLRAELGLEGHPDLEEASDTSVPSAEDEPVGAGR